MTKLIRTNSNNQDFVSLVKQLDIYLALVDGEDHDFYNQYNQLEEIPYVVLAYLDSVPVACGAIKEYNNKTMEIKRMFTLSKKRGRGLASKILEELEGWAKELSNSKCILETGKQQIEAVNLYKRKGYVQIPNYGQYKGIENSLCFEKTIS